jgi:ABC-type sugar transport system substrate-binding protein
MKFKRCMVAAALAAVASLSAVSSARAQEPDRLRGVITEVKADRPYRIGVAMVHFVDDFWKGITYGLVDEAQRANVKIVRIMGAGGYGKVAEQIAQLETLSTMDVDAVVIGSTDFAGFDRAIKRLTDKGIKVIAVGVPVNSPQVSFGVTINEAEVGRRMATFVCKEDPKAKVATIPGPNGPVWNKLRFDGFKQGAEACPGMQLVGNTFQGSTKLEDGMSQGADLLVKNPDANFIYAAAVGLGTGAGMAAKRAGSKARVVTAAITDRTVDLMKEGHIAMVVTEQPILMGRSTIQMATRLLNGAKLPEMTPAGTIPYPQFLVPLFEIMPKDLASYSLNLYDQPPPGWQLPSLQ